MNYRHSCIEESVSPPLDAAEGILASLLGLYLKVEGSCRGGSSGEVDTGDFLEAQVHGRLVDVDETSLQRVEEAWGGLVGAGDALSPRVTVEELGVLTMFSEVNKSVL